MSIVIADKLAEEVVDEFRQLGQPVRVDPSISAADLEAGLPDAEVLIVRSTKVRRAAIEGSPRLGLIVRAGAGTSNIDVDAASERAIAVCNCPGRNAIAVAELVFGLLLAIDRRIAEGTQLLRDGRWEKSNLGDGLGLFGRRLGVIGTGNIGCEVVQRAMAMGMKVSAWSRSLTRENAADLGVDYCDDLPSLARACDFVTVHVASTPQTRGMLDAGFFAEMRDGAYIINCARGDVIDAKALLDAMDAKGIRAGLDVFPDEPGSGSAPFDSALAAHPNVVASHHIGASTKQATIATAQEALRVVRRYLESGDADNAINLWPDAGRGQGIMVRHQDRVGVLAGIFDVLKRHDYNVASMANVIFAGGKAATARILLGRKPDLDEIRPALMDCDGVIQVSAIRQAETE